MSAEDLIDDLLRTVDRLREWHVQHGMPKGMTYPPHCWTSARGNARDCWCPAGADHESSPLDAAANKWDRLEADNRRLRLLIGEFADRISGGDSRASVVADMRHEADRGLFGRDMWAKANGIRPSD